MEFLRGPIHAIFEAFAIYPAAFPTTAALLEALVAQIFNEIRVGLELVEGHTSTLIDWGSEEFQSCVQLLSPLAGLESEEC